MKIENSSAISEINFGKDHGIIGITFRQGKEYDFTTDYADEVKADIESAVANGESGACSCGGNFDGEKTFCPIFFGCVIA